MKQKGITLVSFIFVLSMGSLLLLITMRLVPLYYEHYSIKSAITSLQELPLRSQDDFSVAKIQFREALRRRFDLNNINSVKMRDIKITLDKNGYEVSAKYQLKTHVISNIDVIMTFHDKVLVPHYVR